MARSNSKMLLALAVLFLSGCTLEFEEFSTVPPEPDMTVSMFDSGVEDASAEDVVIIDAGQVDMAQMDTDGDGVVDPDDNCPMVANPDQADQDADELGDACDDDVDGDGVENDVDNCLTVDNSGQLDADGDGQGDACDDDLDGDGLSVEAEMMRGTDPNRRDTDFDGVRDDEDLCPLQADPYNRDTDGDMRGDACDIDDDNDGIVDWWDNCHLIANPDEQNDPELGMACQADYDADGIENAVDLCPFQWGPSADEQPCVPRFDVWTYASDVRALGGATDATLAIGTAGGLYGLDGAGFQRRGFPDQVDTMDIQAVTVSESDWYVLTDQGLTIIDANYPRATNVRAGDLPDAPVGEFRDVETFDGRVWLATDEGLNVFQGDAWSVWGEDVLGTTDIRGVYLDPVDRIWVLSDIGAARVGNDGVEQTFDSLPPEVGAFHDAKDAGNGRTWLIAENGAVLLSAGDLVEATLTGISPLDIGSARESLIATQDGVVRIDTAHRPFPVSYKPLPTQRIHAALGERDGINNRDLFWLGTTQGLHRVGGLFSTFAADRLGDCVTTSTRVGTLLWVGTSQGLFLGQRDGTFAAVSGDTLPGFDPGMNPQPRVNVIQEVNGEVWVGTNGGIARFDSGGNPLGQIVAELRGPGQENQAIAVTDIEPAIGETWVATQGFGLKNLSAQGTWVHYASGNTQNLVDDTINALAYDGNTLWVATPSGLSVYRNGVFLQPILTIPGGRLPTESVDDVAVGEGYVFAATTQGVAIGSPQGQWVTIRRDTGGIPSEAGTNSARSVQYYGGSLWVALEDSRQQPRGSLLRRPANPNSPNDGVLYPSLDIGLPDSVAAGGVRLGQVGEEFFVNVCGDDMSPGGLSILGAGDLVARSVIGEDAGYPVRGTGQSARLTGGPEGAPLLVGIEDDQPIADQLIGGTVVPLSLPDEFMAPPVSCGTPQVSGDTLWCAFDGEGFAKLNENGRWSATRAAGLPVIEGLSLREIVVVDDRAWWMATDGGVIRLMGGSLMELNVAFTDNGLPSDDVRTVLLHEGTLYAGTAAGVGILDIESGTWTQLGRDALPNLSVRALAIDADGALWIGTDAGVAKRTLPEGPSADYSILTGLWDNRINDLAFDGGGTLYVATAGGISVINEEGMVTRLTRYNGLPGGHAYEIKVVDDQVWVRSDHGVARIR